MRNIPMFTTKSGAASLILEEIPYKQTAYIKIQSTCAPEELLSECVCFCKAAGAEHIYATGHPYLDRYPLHTTVFEMSANRINFTITDAYAVSVDQDMLTEWICLFNQKMQGVPNAATMTVEAGSRYRAENSAFFVYRDHLRIGLGVAYADHIRAIASLQPGAGKDVLNALSQKLSGDKVTVEVASANGKAMRLYTELGFSIGRTISEWYIVY